MSKTSSFESWLLTLTVTNNIIELTTAPYHPALILPSSKHLAKRRNAPHQTDRTQEHLTTLGGRIYLTNVTIASQTFSLVVDTGSSDTWVAASTFQCEDPSDNSPVFLEYCSFGPLYDLHASPTFQPIDFEFAVNYTGGENLRGGMGTEMVDISNGGDETFKVRQTIGVVETGYWSGDGISSGLIGLAFSVLARGLNTHQLNYTSILFTL
jgi:hypothetical protein